jgi:hypothetical protein
MGFSFCCVLNNSKRYHQALEARTLAKGYEPQYWPIGKISNNFYKKVTMKLKGKLKTVEAFVQV